MASESEQKEAMIEILMEQCKSVDKLYLESGIEEEQIQEGLVEHCLENDVDFKKIM